MLRLKHYLRLWILVKAFNRMRNKVKPSAKMSVQVDTNDHTKVGDCAQVTKPSSSLQSVQTHRRHTASTAPDDLSAIQPTSFSSLDTADRRTKLFDNDYQDLRRTSRTSKPWKDIDVSNRSTVRDHQCLDIDINSADNFSLVQEDKRRVSKRAWSKKSPRTNAESQQSRSNMELDQDEKTSAFPANQIDSKSSLIYRKNSAHAKTSDNAHVHAFDWTRRQSERLRKDPSPMPTLDTPQPNRTRRPRKAYRSEKIVIDSDSGEDSVLPVTSPTQVMGAQTHRASPHTIQENQGSNRIPTEGSKLEILSGTQTERGSLNACLSCSRRHQRCDRTRPSCGRCVENKFSCEYIEAARLLTSRDTTPKSQLTRRYTGDVGYLHDTQSGLAANDVISLTGKDILLNDYWGQEVWQLVFLQAHERKILLATMRSLGLKATLLHHTNFKFGIEHFVSLGKDINNIAWTLGSKHSVKQLMECAQDRNYLDEEIDSLFEIYSSIWSLDSDRTKLLSPGFDENYPRDLFYEESDDQKM